MDLALSEVLARVQTWETKQSRISGMVLADWSHMVVKFAGRVTVTGDVITFIGSQFEFRLSLAPDMTFKYVAGVLDIGVFGWRCVLYETDAMSGFSESENLKEEAIICKMQRRFEKQ
jgi:hypothetical protein